MTDFNERIPAVREFVDGLSTNQLRDALELLLSVFAYRQKDACGEEKFSGRTMQKRLAAVLRNANADWFVREHVLNAGRALYLYDGDRHDYYGEELLALVTRAAKDARVKGGELEVENAMKRLHGEIATRFTGPDLIKANIELVKIASKIVNAALDSKGFTYFTPSERSVLTGVVDVPTARRLATRPDEQLAE